MNLRDRITPQRDNEEPYIKFNLESKGTECEAYCNDEELAMWLANVINLSHKMLNDHFDDKMKKVIVKHRMKDLKDLFLNDEEC